MSWRRLQLTIAILLYSIGDFLLKSRCEKRVSGLGFALDLAEVFRFIQLSRWRQANVKRKGKTKPPFPTVLRVWYSSLRIAHSDLLHQLGMNTRPYYPFSVWMVISHRKMCRRVPTVILIVIFSQSFSQSFSESFLESFSFKGLRVVVIWITEKKC